MESLVANYASSDEEDQPSSSSSRAASFSSALPQPKASSLINSLPQPNQFTNPTLPVPAAFLDGEQIEGNSGSSSNLPSGSDKSSSLFSSLPPPNQNLALGISSDGDDDGKSFKSSLVFSSLPPPNSQISPDIDQNLSSTKLQSKRVVQFKPPIQAFSRKGKEDSDTDESDVENLDRRRREEAESLPQAPSVMSFLSSIPAPKNSKTLGVLPSSGSGRRSILETPEPVSTSHGCNGMTTSNVPQNDDNAVHQTDYQQANYDDSTNYNFGIDQNTWSSVNYDGYGNYQSGNDQNLEAQTQFGNCESYDDYSKYGNSWADGSSAIKPEISGAVENTLGVTGKRRRNDVPTDIVEVNQDELMKNRPRADQAKLTGIAFGPSYQAAASTKGKPSKLHKRKHQIGSLFFDMKQKETELAERRAKGFLTKAETHAKYGW